MSFIFVFFSIFFYFRNWKTLFFEPKQRINWFQPGKCFVNIREKGRLGAFFLVEFNLIIEIIDVLRYRDMSLVLSILTHFQKNIYSFSHTHQLQNFKIFPSHKSHNVKLKPHSTKTMFIVYIDFPDFHVSKSLFRLIRKIWFDWQTCLRW